MSKRFGILLFAALLLACFMQLPVKAAEGGDEGAAGAVETANRVHLRGLVLCRKAGYIF